MGGFIIYNGDAGTAKPVHQAFLHVTHFLNRYIFYVIMWYNFFTFPVSIKILSLRIEVRIQKVYISKHCGKLKNSTIKQVALRISLWLGGTAPQKYARREMSKSHMVSGCGEILMNSKVSCVCGPTFVAWLCEALWKAACHYSIWWPSPGAVFVVASFSLSSLNRERGDNCSAVC